MSTRFLSLIAGALLVGCAPPSKAPRSVGTTVTNGALDPIDRLVATCEASQRSGGSHFPDGPFSPIALPASAPPAELVSQALERQAGDAKPHTNFTILSMRPVHIGIPEMAGIADPNYTAVLIRTGARQEIVLLQFQAPVWWSHVYDTE